MLKKCWVQASSCNLSRCIYQASTQISLLTTLRCSLIQEFTHLCQTFSFFAELSEYENVIIQHVGVMHGDTVTRAAFVRDDLLKQNSYFNTNATNANTILIWTSSNPQLWEIVERITNLHRFHHLPTFYTVPTHAISRQSLHQLQKHATIGIKRHAPWVMSEKERGEMWQKTVQIDGLARPLSL